MSGHDAAYRPHKLRSRVRDDEDVAVVFLSVWVDDVSGNHTKQYNKHLNVYINNTNLPAQVLNKEQFTNFISTSQHATSSEQLSELMKVIK